MRARGPQPFSNGEKRLTHKEALLALLSDYQTHDMAECLRVGGYRYGARLHELRRQGYVIETISEGDDVFSYRLVAAPGEARQLSLA